MLGTPSDAKQENEALDHKEKENLLKDLNN